MDAPSRPSRPWLVANALWGLLFAYAAAMNLNDPDPLVWVSLYSAGVGVCILDSVGQLRMRTSLFMAFGYTLAAVWIASAGLENSQPMKGFPQYGVFREEIVRESLGLFLVALWCGALGLRDWLAARKGD